MALIHAAKQSYHGFEEEEAFLPSRGQESRLRLEARIQVAPKEARSHGDFARMATKICAMATNVCSEKWRREVRSHGNKGLKSTRVKRGHAPKRQPETATTIGSCATSVKKQTFCNGYASHTSRTHYVVTDRALLAWRQKPTVARIAKENRGFACRLLADKTFEKKLKVERP
ncbi:hypothetical protein K469DRAFT_685237 [Zopfia rhizophila CBS 207.26]|uniref:Uncharacterized protein n=1 Tax=Zopfia rhizophila CBS 207.26 TaxID=1314779 RepID=A0A6A6D6U1_9PEZI|nr:hypothetical protein K469DRAFT_685237 [Zopfia rhizophila CBS 207.26]